MANTMKQAMASAITASKTAKTSKGKKLENKAKDAKVVPIFTPMQVLGQFEQDLDKQTSKELTPLYENLLDEFASEANSRINIGKTLIAIRKLLGDVFGQFLQKCVVKELRKSAPTCYRYIGLADAFNLKFFKSKPVSVALSRIWDAEGCFDTTTGELKPVVDKAILACGGIPENADSDTAETWARKFVDTVDSLVSNKRKAQVKGNKAWDADTYAKKHDALIGKWKNFAANKSNGVTSKRIIATMAEMLAILIDAVDSKAANEAVRQATILFAKGKQAAKDAAKEMELDNAEGPDVPLNQVSA